LQANLVVIGQLSLNIAPRGQITILLELKLADRGLCAKRIKNYHQTHGHLTGMQKVEKKRSSR
jgi:hypothetical protein